jgi:hypothetical protein
VRVYGLEALLAAAVSTDVRRNCKKPATPRAMAHANMTWATPHASKFINTTITNRFKGILDNARTVEPSREGTTVDRSVAVLTAEHHTAGKATRKITHNHQQDSRMLRTMGSTSHRTLQRRGNRRRPSEARLATMTSNQTRQRHQTWKPPTLWTQKYVQVEAGKSTTRTRS